MTTTGILYTLTAFVCSLAMTTLTMPWLLSFCKKRGLYDMPNERKVHHNNIPRLGGVLFVPAMMVGISAAFGLMMLHSPTHLPTFRVSTFIILSGIFLIYCIGLLDDLFGLNARLKFLIQFVASLFMPLCGLYLNNLYGFCGIYEIPIYVGYPLTVFIVLLIVNSINLIDGIDGLAAGLGIIALSIYLVLFYRIGSLTYMLFTASLLGTIGVFFFFNMFGKAERNTKTFMGDTGSLILGYAIAFLAIKYAMNNEYVLPYRASAIVVAYTSVIVPAFDLIRVALMRIKRGVSIFHADKTHIHHLFMAAGCSMRTTLLLILAMQMGFWAINLTLQSVDCALLTILIIDLLLYGAVIFCLNSKKR